MFRLHCVRATASCIEHPERDASRNAVPREAPNATLLYASKVAKSLVEALAGTRARSSDRHKNSLPSHTDPCIAMLTSDSTLQQLGATRLPNTKSPRVDRCRQIDARHRNAVSFWAERQIGRLLQDRRFGPLLYREKGTQNCRFFRFEQASCSLSVKQVVVTPGPRPPMRSYLSCEFASLS